MRFFDFPGSASRIAPATLALFVFSAAIAEFAPPLPTASAQTPAQYEQARRKLVDETLVASGITNPRVLQAMRDTHRHEFVGLALRKNAYYDMALPIGDRQTISSPFIVAYMTESLDPQPTDRVLEIGTGSGYQAAVLSPLVKDVYSIEIVEPLGVHARQVLNRLKYKNVHTKIGDGFQGWAEHAPFDKIIVTCSPEKVPQPLVDQLAEGGLMVIPVGERYQQSLSLMRKKEGKLSAQTLRPTLFVPMTGRAEDERKVKPDPLNPRAVNGNFEENAEGLSYIPGWYYEQQATWISASQAPEGRHYVQFQNEQMGRGSHLLQGFPIDGRSITDLELSAWVKTELVVLSERRDERAAVAISFYDENRKELGVHWLGPFSGSREWRQERTRIRVPIGTREGILRVGLFGSTGTFLVDDVVIRPIGD